MGWGFRKLCWHKHRQHIVLPPSLNSIQVAPFRVPESVTDWWHRYMNHKKGFWWAPLNQETNKNLSLHLEILDSLAPKCHSNKTTINFIDFALKCTLMQPELLLVVWTFQHLKFLFPGLFPYVHIKSHYPKRPRRPRMPCLKPNTSYPNITWKPIPPS